MRTSEYRLPNGDIVRLSSLGNKFEFDLSEPHSAYDYILYQDGTYFYVKNAKTGKIESKFDTGSDALEYIASTISGGEIVWIDPNVSIQLSKETPIIFTNPIKLKSAGATIRLSDPGTSSVVYLEFHGENSEISGFIFDGTDVTSAMDPTAPRTVIRILNNKSVVSHNYFIHCENLYGIGVRNDDFTLNMPTVGHNYFDGISIAILVHNSYSPLVSHNVILNSTVAGIQLYKYDEKAIVSNNVIHFANSSSTRKGIYLGHSSTAPGTSNNHLVTNNVILNADWGILIPTQTYGHEIQNNLIFVNENGEGIHVETECHDWTVTGNRIVGSGGTGTGINVLADNYSFEISKNRIEHFQIGISLSTNDSTTYSTISFNYILGYDSSTDRGIYIKTSNNLRILYNTLANLYRGIWVGYGGTDASNLDIIGNTIRANDWDIYNQSTGSNIWVMRNSFDNFTGSTSNIIFRDNIGFDEHTIPTSAPSNPTSGSMYFDPSTGTLYVYDGSTWKSVTLS